MSERESEKVSERESERDGGEVKDEEKHARTWLPSTNWTKSRKDRAKPKSTKCHQVAMTNFNKKEQSENLDKWL